MKITTNDIAEKLREKRLQRGYTIEQLSELSDTSVGTISMLENKRRTNISVLTLLRLMEALNVKGYEIFGSSDENINDLVAENQRLRNTLRSLINSANEQLEQ